MYVEPNCSRCDRELMVMGGEAQFFELFTCQQRAGEMDRIQRSQHGRKRLCRSLQYNWVECDQAECIEGFHHFGSVSCDGGIFQVELDPSAIDRAKTLQPDQFARDWVRDLRPDTKSLGLPQYDTKQD